MKTNHTKEVIEKRQSFKQIYEKMNNEFRLTLSPDELKVFDEAPYIIGTIMKSLPKDLRVRYNDFIRDYSEKNIK